MGRGSEESQSFSEPSRAASQDASDLDHVVGEWPRPIKERHWTDEQGVRWHIRGRGIEADGPALRRLLKRPGLRVLHVYGPSPREVSGEECRLLLERVNRFAAGEAPPHSHFWLADFRNEERQVMLVIEEAC